MNPLEIAGIVTGVLVLAVIIAARWGPLAPNAGQHVSPGPPDHYQRWDSDDRGSWLPATLPAWPVPDHTGELRLPFWLPVPPPQVPAWVAAVLAAPLADLADPARYEELIGLAA